MAPINRPINSSMSEINEIVAQIKQSTDYQINKAILREKIISDLHVAYNNGLFLINPETISFVASWPDGELFLEDVYNNPIKINKDEFLKISQQHYQQVMNAWHIQHEELKRVRKI